MPVKLPADLPAARVLAQEGIATDAPARKDASRLRIGLVNLMPDKAVTEIQFARLLAAAPFESELVLLKPASYTPRNTSEHHMRRFYRSWPEVRAARFDGLIVTGAPVETLPFERVSYWNELASLFEWAARRVPRTLYVCWAAQAALRHLRGVPKRPLDEKLFGVFPQRVLEPRHPLLSGFGQEFPTPVSRHTEVRLADLPRGGGLRLLAGSSDAGLCLVEDTGVRALYMFNHLEYDADTLRREYLRDLELGRPVPVPRNYFPNDDPERVPENTWARHGRLLAANWLSMIAAEAPARGLRGRRRGRPGRAFAVRVARAPAERQRDEPFRRAGPRKRVA